MEIKLSRKEIEVILNALQYWDDAVTEDRLYIPDLERRLEKLLEEK